MATLTGVAPVLAVDGPAPVRLPYGIETAGTLVPEVNDRFLSGTVAWHYALAATELDIDRCILAESPPRTKDTTRDPGGGDPYEPFGVVLGLDCTGFVLRDAEEFQRRVQVAMEAEEWTMVEAEFFDSHLGNHSLKADAQDLAGIASATVGLGLLEQEFAHATKTRGILHMSRTAATVYANRQVLVERGGMLQTLIGTPVVVSAEYDGSAPDGGGAAPADTHHEYVYISGPLHIRRTALAWVGDEPSQLLQRDLNLAEVRSERWYTLTFDPSVIWAQQVDFSTL